MNKIWEKESELYINSWEFYTANEEQRAEQIRNMRECVKKHRLLAKFIIETCKPFPHKAGVWVGLNLDTAFLSSQEIEKSSQFLDEYTYNSRIQRIFI